MMLNDIKKFKFVGPNVKVLGPWVLLTVLLVILFVFTLKFGYSQVTTRVISIRDESEMENTLKEKIKVLKEVDPGLLSNTSKLLIALPDRNMASWVISQVKATAIDNSISIQYLELRNQLDTKDIIEMKLAVEGASRTHIIDDVVGFLTSLDSIAPLVLPEEINVSYDEEEGITFKTELVIFWSSLPTQLPPLEQPVIELTAQEIELVKKITALRYPTLVNLDPTNPAFRENPFQ